MTYREKLNGKLTRAAGRDDDAGEHWLGILRDALSPERKIWNRGATAMWHRRNKALPTEDSAPCSVCGAPQLPGDGLKLYVDMGCRMRDGDAFNVYAPRYFLICKDCAEAAASLVQAVRIKREEREK